LLYRYFKKILCLLSTAPFYQMYIQLGTGEYVPSKIRRNPIFFPYFKDAIAAIDGSHIPAAPPALLHRQYRNRKGYLSQNALFDLKFTYTLSGWEESAMDACIYDDAIVSNGLRILDRKYLLANAGYPLRPQLLVPYQGICYHLAEWGCMNIWYTFAFCTNHPCTHFLIPAPKTRKNCSIFNMQWLGMWLNIFLVL